MTDTLNLQVKRRYIDMKKAVVISILLTFFICSCTMAPKYTRPEAPIPSTWPKGDAYEDIENVSDVSKVVGLDWREFFTDTKLKQIIDMALQNNRDLRIAALNVEKARALYGIQRAELFPTLNAYGVWTEQKIPADISTKSGEAMNFKQFNANLGVVSWEIDFFGRIRSLKDRALEQYLATEQAHRSARLALITEVANVCLSLAADRENLKYARSTLLSQQESYDLIHRRYEMGVASELDLRMVQTRLEAVKVDVFKYTRQVALNENALNLLVGSTVPPELLPDSLSVVAEPKDVSPGLSSEVLLRRPDILQAEGQLKAANASIGAARAAFFPRISLTGVTGTTSDELSGLFKAGSNTWTFSPQIVMPIFDPRLWSALEASKVEREIVLSQYEKAVQNAFKEASDTLAARGTISKQLNAQQSLVRASEETYRLATARYMKGIDGYLGVLDAQRFLYAAQQNLVNFRFLHLANRVTLYKVLGGG